MSFLQKCHHTSYNKSAEVALEVASMSFFDLAVFLERADFPAERLYKSILINIFYPAKPYQSAGISSRGKMGLGGARVKPDETSRA